MTDKVTLTALANLQNDTTATTAINANSVAITTAMDNTLSRDGTSPNTMGASLDMNSNQILNLPSPNTNNSPLRFIDLANFLGTGSIVSGVAGPGSSTANGLARWNGTTGQLLKDSTNASLSDAGDISTVSLHTTSTAAGSLCIGSAFTAAQPALFNIFDNQAPADSRKGYFGVITPGSANGAFISASYGSTTTPITSGSAAIVYQNTYDTTVAGNIYTGIWQRSIINAGTGGGASAVLVNLDLQGTWTPSGTLPGGTALQTLATTSVGGNIFGENPYVRSTGTAAATIVGSEIDTDFRSSGGGTKIGLQIVDVAQSTATPTTSTALFFTNQVSAYGWDTGILFSNSSQFPIRTTGTLIKCTGGTFTNGIDLSGAVSITGNAWNSSGFVVTGVGQLTLSGNILQNIGGVVPTITPAAGHTITSQGTGAGYTVSIYGAQGTNIFSRINGTIASPTKLINNDIIAQLVWKGWDASGVLSGNQLAVRGNAAEDWNDATHRGTYFRFDTTPTASATLTEAMRIQPSGGLSVGTTTDPGIGCIQVLNNVIIGTAAKTLVLKQGANGTCGTFVCNGATPVTVSNTNIAITDTIIISLNTVGGTVGGAAKANPMVTAITAATSFQTTGQATDTSTYNYAIIKNAA